MSVSLSILTALSPSFPARETVLNQRVRINVPQWRQVEEETRDPEVTWALEALPDTVTRSHIIGLHHEDPNIRRRRIAIASLMWGYGIRGARWARWAHDISNFLSPDLDAGLAECEANLTAGAIAEAYKLFTCPAPRGTEREAHHGIGSSFFTKILYFLARNALQGRSAHYPLILDTNVSRALAAGRLPAACPTRGLPPTPGLRRLRALRKDDARVGRQLNVLPEVIEYYLWTEAGEFSFWVECTVQHAQDFP